MSKQEICVARHLHHVAIAVNDIEENLKLYRNLFGVSADTIEYIPDQMVRATMLKIGSSHLEFIQPTDPRGSVARFIERHGETMHHICLEIDNLQAKLDVLANKGVELIDKAPRKGLSGSIAFIHPRSTRGVLIELVDQDLARRENHGV